MARPGKVSMPTSTGGLVRYFDEYKSKIEFKPGHIIVLVIIIIVIELVLHMYGYSMFGFR
ncbi:preprotein translocase subunit Sec61beta [Candidatus Woesearchaeota archaeon]|nr:preprotein translocase subunit Sec61beta [Candidatus Woesearchaeota archaeon]MBW3000056.1 preprotein translocase subunit Sec61beta [Candidatus Woesearchaeota archaeon]